MDRMNFTQAVARLRVLEKRLLNELKFERMMDSSSAMEAIKVLQETEYSAFMGNVKKPEDYDLLLKEELKRVYDLMYEVSPDKSIVDIMSLKYDYHNLKVLLKGKILDKDLDYLLMDSGSIKVERLKLLIATEDYKVLPKFMKEAFLEAEKSFFTDKDPQKIDTIIDRYMYKDLVEKTQSSEYDFIEEYMKSNIDFINVRTYIRLKKQQKPFKFFSGVYIEGGSIKEEFFFKNYENSLENIMDEIPSYIKYNDVIKKGIEDYITTARLSSFEKLWEDYIMKKAKEAKYVNFGPEPIISYIIAKETEIKLLRIIMVGKINNLPVDSIRERLRDIYV